jgi:hypothetical protein
MRISTTRASGSVEGNRSVARRLRRRAARAALPLAVAAVLAGCSEKGVKDENNELPFGHVEVPAQGAEVKMLTPVAGWAMDDRGIREIRLYVDNHIVNSGRTGQDRPDVSRAYPRYTRGDHHHGWTVLAGFDAPGPHTILVQAVDSDGATRDIAVINVTAVDK